MANWINVKDKLPEDDELVLTIKNGIYDLYRYEKKRNGWVSNGMYWSIALVSHWMQLPEPPEERKMENKPLTL